MIVGKVEYAPNYNSQPALTLPVHTTAEGDLIERMKKDLRWFVDTMEWLADPKNKGGITTCNKHNGHGFQSDCAICSKIRLVKAGLSGV